MKSFEEVKRELASINPKRSLMFPEEQKTLYEQALGSCKIVELGSYCGSSSFILFNALNENGQLICVDEFKEGFDAQPFTGQEARNEWHRVMGFAYPKVVLLDTSTHKASKLFKPQFIDFLFIDADHSYKGVKQDLEDWIPLLKFDGTVALHDYTNPACSGIKQAFEEYTQNLWPLITSTWSLYIFRKPL